MKRSIAIGVRRSGQGSRQRNFFYTMNVKQILHPKALLHSACPSGCQRMRRHKVRAMYGILILQMMSHRSGSRCW